MIARAAAFFGRKDVRDLRKLDIVNYQNYLEASGIRAKYQKNYLGLFRTFLNWIRADLELLDQVPAFPVVQVPVRPYRWISSEDQIKLVDQIPSEDRPVIEFLMLHGCRPAEARALRVRDLDLRQERVTISSSYSGRVLRDQRKGRGAHPYTIPIHPESMPFIRERCTSCLPGAFVFVNPRTNTPYSDEALQRIWRAMRAKAGISADLRLYDATRHSVATQLRLAGVPLPDIKDQLGHTDIRSTMRYAHGDIKNLRANLEKLSLRKVEKLGAKAATRNSAGLD